jgi:hypothetical protein
VNKSISGSSVILACRDISSEAQPLLQRKLQQEPTRIFVSENGLLYPTLLRAVFAKAARNIHIAVDWNCGQTFDHYVCHEVGYAFDICGHSHSHSDDVPVLLRMSPRIGKNALPTQETLHVHREATSSRPALRVYVGGKFARSEREAKWAQSA